MDNNYYRVGDSNLYYNKICFDFIKPKVECKKCLKRIFYNELDNKTKICKKCKIISNIVFV